MGPYYKPDPFAPVKEEEVDANDIEIGIKKLVLTWDRATTAWRVFDFEKRGSISFQLFERGLASCGVELRQSLKHRLWDLLNPTKAHVIDFKMFKATFGGWVNKYRGYIKRMKRNPRSHSVSLSRRETEKADGFGSSELIELYDEIKMLKGDLEEHKILLESEKANYQRDTKALSSELEITKVARDDFEAESLKKDASMEKLREETKSRVEEVQGVTNQLMEEKAARKADNHKNKQKIQNLVAENNRVQIEAQANLMAETSRWTKANAELEKRMEFMTNELNRERKAVEQSQLSAQAANDNVIQAARANESQIQALSKEIKSLRAKLHEQGEANDERVKQIELQFEQMKKSSDLKHAQEVSHLKEQAEMAHQSKKELAQAYDELQIEMKKTKNMIPTLTKDNARLKESLESEVEGRKRDTAVLTKKLNKQIAKNHKDSMEAKVARASSDEKWVQKCEDFERKIKDLSSTLETERKNLEATASALVLANENAANTAKTAQMQLLSMKKEIAHLESEILSQQKSHNLTLKDLKTSQEEENKDIIEKHKQDLEEVSSKLRASEERSSDLERELKAKMEMCLELNEKANKFYNDLEMSKAQLLREKEDRALENKQAARRLNFQETSAIQESKQMEAKLTGEEARFKQMQSKFTKTISNLREELRAERVCVEATMAAQTAANKNAAQANGFVTLVKQNKEKEIEDLKQMLDDTKANSKAQLSEMKTSFAEKESKLRQINEQNLKEISDELNKRVKELEQDLKESHASREDFQNTCKLQLEQIESLKQDLQSKHATLEQDNVKLTRKVEDLKQRYSELEAKSINTAATAHQTIKKLSEEIESNTKEMQSLAEEVAITSMEKTRTSKESKERIASLEQSLKQTKMDLEEAVEKLRLARLSNKKKDEKLKDARLEARVNKKHSLIRQKYLEEMHSPKRGTWRK